MNIARSTHSRFTRFLVSIILVVMVLPPMLKLEPVVSATGAEQLAATEQIFLLVGRSAIIRTDRDIARVSLSTPKIADAMVTSPRELLVHGKTVGTISLLVWSDTGRITPYEVVVRRDLSPLEAQVRRQFPQEQIGVASNGKDVVLSGIVSTNPSTKVGDVSVMVFDVWSWERIVAELAKCVVRCANCHRRKEAEVRSFWRHRWMVENGLSTVNRPMVTLEDGSEDPNRG